VGHDRNRRGGQSVRTVIARNDLLRAEIYPDSDDPLDGLASQGDDQAYDRVEYGYNRQGPAKE
jgi:hypothetical protein